MDMHTLYAPLYIPPAYRPPAVYTGIPHTHIPSLGIGAGDSAGIYAPAYIGVYVRA